MGIRSVLLVFAMALAGTAFAQVPGGDKAQPAPKPTPLEEAQKLYDQTQTLAQEAKRKAFAEAEQNYRRVMRNARQEYLVKLNTALKAALAAEKLEEANRIDGLRKLMEAELKVLDMQETAAPLSLETNDVWLQPGKEVWIKARSGEMSMTGASNEVLKVAIDKDKGLLISAAAQALPAKYAVVVKGTAGPDAVVNVYVPLPTPPTPGRFTLILDQSQIELKEKEMATRTLKVTNGKALSAKVKDGVKGLTATIEDAGKRVKINATKDITAGKYEVLVTGESGTSFRVEVNVLSKGTSAVEFDFLLGPFEIFGGPIEFTEGKEGTRLLKRQTLTLLHAKVAQPGKGLTTNVEDEGKTLKISATKDLKAGTYEIDISQYYSSPSITYSYQLEVIVKK